MAKFHLFFFVCAFKNSLSLLCFKLFSSSFWISTSSFSFLYNSFLVHCERYYLILQRLQFWFVNPYFRWNFSSPIILPLVVRKKVVDKGVIMTYTIVGTSSSIKGNNNIDRKWNERLQIKTPVNFRSNYFLIQPTSFVSKHLACMVYQDSSEHLFRLAKMTIY